MTRDRRMTHEGTCHRYAARPYFGAYHPVDNVFWPPVNKDTVICGEAEGTGGIDLPFTCDECIYFLIGETEDE